MVTLLTIALATTLLVLGLLFLSGRFHPGASAPWKQEARVKIRLADLWRCEGMLDRGPYLLMGTLLFTLKHNLDRFLASYVFHRRWSVFNYLEPAKSGSLRSLSHEEAVFYGVLAITALPFIWVGVALTLRRLRATRLPTGLVLFFFLPVVNLLFFLMLSILPSSQVHEFSPSPRWGRFKRILHRIIPDHAVGSAAVGLLLTLIIALPSLFFGVRILGNYGWGLFVGLPFCLGLSSVLIYSFHHPRSLGSCLLVSVCSVGLAAAVLFGLAVEGLICLFMAAPLALALAVFGGIIGYFVQLQYRRPAEVLGMLSVMFLSVPVFMEIEHLNLPESPLFAVHTALNVAAPPAQVWRNVIAFSQLLEPTEWLFRIGIAYPMRAEIDGQGVGAERHCLFSTGPFIEPIQVWDEPRLLKFSVTSNPPPMQEWTPYAEIHPPHLKGFLISRGGQFRLIPLSNGQTRLEGTTWYQHHLWPASYWQVWSDFIIHRIHLRVLNHIKALSEQKA